MTTSATIITNAMRLFGILDAQEQPTSADIANNVQILNDLLRNEHADGAAQYLVKRVQTTLPPGVSGAVYSFSIGTAQPTYLIQSEAVAVRSIYMNDINLTINRETRQAPIADCVRTTYPGIVTKWHQECQSDNSVLVTAWQPPRAPSNCLIEFAGRFPLLSDPGGGDTVQLPSEGVHDATLLLGMTISGSYGRPLDKVDPVLYARAKAVDDRWKNWARGQQWLRLVRA